VSPLSRRPEARARQLANLAAKPPPPEVGNQRAARHRGYSAVTEGERDERAKAIYAALAASAPLRDGDGGLPVADEMVIGLLAESLVRRERVTRWLGDFGSLHEKTGEPKAAVELERRLRMEALDLARELGLTPRSRAALGLDVARGFDLAAHWAEQDRLERAADAVEEDAPDG